jgi:hypothetical protein
MAFVSGANASNAGGTGTFTVSVTKSVTAGNTLIVQVNIQNSVNNSNPPTGWLSSVTDNATGGTNTYVSPAGNFVGFSDSVSPFISLGDWVLYCQTLKSTQSLTVTANFALGASSAQFASILIGEYSSLGTFDVLGAMRSQSHPATTANTIASTAATVTAGDTLIGVTINWSSIGVSAGTGFTQDYVDATPASTAATYMFESLSGSSSGSKTATFTASSTATDFATAMLAFNAPATDVLMAQVCM